MGLIYWYKETIQSVESVFF